MRRDAVAFRKGVHLLGESGSPAFNAALQAIMSARSLLSLSARLERSVDKRSAYCEELVDAPFLQAADGPA